MQNLSKTMHDTKSRAILIALLIILLFALGIGYVKLKRSSKSGVGVSSNIEQAPSISSIPGVGQPTREYAKLQEQQNIQQAQEATKKGTAAIPTIVRTTYLESGVSPELGNKSGAASTAGCSVEDLRKARTAGVTAAELRCRGCSLAALKAAGYTAAELRAAGFSAKELKDAGFSSAELRAAGFSAKDLKDAGFSAADLRSAGFSAGELKDAGFSDDDIKKAGFSDDELKSAGIGAGALASTITCSVESLRTAKSQGVSAAQLKNLGCSAAALRAAGFTAKELKDAGFSAKELKDAGFSAKDLKNAGFTAGELRAAGFSAKDLKDAGFNVKDLKDAGFSAEELHAAGFSPAELKAAGFSDGDLIRAGISVKDLIPKETRGCSSDNLKRARDRGASIDELRRLGCTDEDLGFKPKGSATTESLLGAPESAAPAEGALSSALGTAPSSNRVASIAPLPGAADWTTQLEKLRRQQAQQLSAQEYQDKIKQLQGTMAGQAGDLFSSWTPLPAQQYVQGNPDQPQGSASGVSGAAAAGAQGAASQQVATIPGDVYKAGSIIFAVLDTGINSDQTSPVMATIVDGPLKNSKVLGVFERRTDRVILQFTVLSVPKLTNSIPINAVAIDPNTARTALATHVDYHYLLRFGTFFASSFLSGLGSAVQNSGSQTNTTDSGQSQHFWPKLNPAQEAMVAMGNVGTQAASVLAPLFSTPPTVDVRAGSGIGILLMGDLNVPKAPKNG